MAMDNNEWAASSPQPLTPVPLADAGAPELATRWPRYVARSFDLMVEAVIIGLLIGALFPSAIASGSALSNELLLGILVLPPAMVLDAVIYTCCGNTPGKALAGLKVFTPQGDKVPFLRYLRRNLHLWLTGLALGLPLINILTLWRSFQRDGLGEFQPWDIDTDTRCYDRARSITRVCVTAVFLVMGYMALRVL
jgi:uncharacterized RDD family membrane protein YckC